MVHVRMVERKRLTGATFSSVMIFVL